jgi:lysophospholipid acyltransferase (LPLAT)-like uncharacterized protein
VLRRLRFFVLERIVLPLAIVPFKLLVWSWRKMPLDAETRLRVTSEPRVVLVTYHGMFLQLVAFATLLQNDGRKLVVMLSPSLDGRLLAAFLAHFGIDHVRASTSRRGISGSLELVRRIRRGEIAIIAIDGPRGPCCVANPGFRRIASAAGARIALAATSATHGIRFGSWDRSHLPLPFARVEAVLELSDPQDGTIEERLLAAAVRLRSPVVPPSIALAPQDRSALEMRSIPPR